MKLKYVTSCIYNSLSVDGKEFNEMSLEEQRKLLHKLVDNADDITLQQLFIEYMRGEFDWYTSDSCEYCGDSIFEYNKEL